MNTFKSERVGTVATVSSLESPTKKSNSLSFTGGRMAEEVSTKDWSQTPLGPIEQWPQSLCTTISLCLASSFPISIVWGPDRTQIYNDGYWQICGDKHPTSMGQDFRVCWRTAWPAIGEAFESAEKGETKFLENQRIFLDRNGYLEETFFTFSFSPIIGESGGIEGLFHPVTELTQQSLGDRRMNLLHNIATRTMTARTTSEAIAQIIDVIKECNLDIPFGLLYSVRADGTHLTLEGNTGLATDSVLCPVEIDLDSETDAFWPFAESMRTGISTRVDNLKGKWGANTCGPYDEAPNSAFVIPVIIPGSKFPFAIMVAGVSARRALDAPYRTFFELVSSAITSAITKAKSFEDEQKKAEALLEIDRAKTTFFSNISHEFRTPLTLMLGPVDDLLNDYGNPLQGEQRERAQLIRRNALRLQRLVNSLLDFSRIEAGRMDAKFSRTDLGSLTRELASVFRAAMEKAGIEYVVDCVASSELIYVDHEMWEKIVFNLLSNALKFTFNGKIVIRLTEEKEAAILQVSDTGEGIPDDDLPNLFKRFYRVQETKSRTHEGSGIGLAFISELVKMHGGTIGVQSKVGKGTTFTVSIPKGNVHLSRERIADEPVLQKAIETSNVFVNESMQWISQEADTVEDDLSENENAEQKRILVVDDNADMREYVARILRKNSHWEIQTAGNGVEALKLIKKKKPALVLSDIMMPEMDGFALLEKIREDITTNQLPVILLSARAGEEATLEGLEKKANDYLVKPFSARELFARIKIQLELEQIRQSNMALAADLGNKTRELEQLTYITTHDLQEPLRTVSNYINLLQEDYSDTLDTHAVRHLNSIHNATNRMQSMVKALLVFSRLGQNQKTTRVDLTILLADVLADLAALIASTGTEIHVGDMPTLNVYEIEIRQLFQNLITNAIKFQRKNTTPKIDIHAEAMHGKWKFSVADNGIGIDPAHRDRIFGIFQRLHTHDAYEGNGIGLANCKKIVELHKGEIWVEGNAAKGSTFNFLL